MVMMLQVEVFCVVAGYQHFRSSSCLHLQKKYFASEESLENHVTN
jgi:hypothetical protein